DGEGELPELLDTLAAAQDFPAEVEDALFLRELLALLTPRQRQVIKATVLEERPEQEVAARLGMSQPAVHRAKYRALKRLRKHLLP
ncbi:MAG: sigma-70 family RNA polymerase sigma factor, partial [Firmicutes bacterium]|nr:sigma-70 family RNA polymerase sigma factor [Bacillota bacterium]